jgi:hypothetical protein
MVTVPNQFAHLPTGLNPLELFDENFTALAQAIDLVEARSVPPGGASGAVLYKASATNYDTEWREGKKRFILTSGRSNAEYRLAYAWTPPPNLYLWDFNGTVDPATKVGTAWLVPDGTTISIALSIAAQEAWANPDTIVYVFQIAKASIPISHWLPGSPDPDMYTCIRANVTAGLALAGGTQIDVVQWWHEGDASAPTGYVTDFNTMVDDWRTETWFAYDTPIIIHGISILYAANYTAFNAYLSACIASEPDFRRFVYTGILPAAYWEAPSYLHGNADGYYAAGVMAWQAWRDGLGRASIDGYVVDPVTGNMLIGPVGIPNTDQLLIKNDQAAATVVEVDNQSASVSARAYIGVKTTAGTMYMQLYPSTSGGGAGTLIYTGAGYMQFALTNAAAYYAWYTSGATLRMTLATNGNLGIGASTPDRRLHSEVDDASNNTVTYPFRVTHTTSGAPGAGIGVGIELEAETSAGNNEVGMTINAVVTDATAGSEDFDLVVNLMTAGAAASEKLRIAGATSLATLTGSLSRGVPVTKTADFTVAATENWLINNKAGSACVVTLPSAAAYPGREIMIKTIQAQTTDSASVNVIPLAGGAAGTAILSANAGRWATLVSNGINWEIQQGVI